MGLAATAGVSSGVTGLMALGLGLGVSTFFFSGLALGLSTTPASRFGSLVFFVATTSTGSRTRTRSAWTGCSGRLRRLRRHGFRLLWLGRSSHRIWTMSSGVLAEKVGPSLSRIPGRGVHW